MREIELRAWDKKWKKMYPHNYICLHNGKFELDTTFPNGDCAETVPAERFELMDYIGFKDLNNVKIFESDIIRVEMEQFAHGGGGWKIIGEIIWRGYGFNFREIKKSGNILNCHLELKTDHIGSEMYLDRFEIIGNRYENEDLLK